MTFKNLFRRVIALLISTIMLIGAISPAVMAAKKQYDYVEENQLLMGVDSSIADVVENIQQSPKDFTDIWMMRFMQTRLLLINHR